MGISGAGETGTAMGARVQIREGWSAAAATAAMAGTGYASGRELVLFFAQLGGASWIAIVTASAAFGLLTGLCALWASRCGSTGFAQCCRRLRGRPVRRFCILAYGLQMAVAGALMLRMAGEAGALALPVRHGFAWGAGLAALLAMLINAGGRRAMPLLGMALLAAGVLFYATLALDPRPPRVYLQGEVRLVLENSIPAALSLGLLYGAMNAVFAGGEGARAAAQGCRPFRLGAACALMLGALLACANAALLRGGRPLLAQALPVVLLAARWGVVGFWLCLLFRFFCATVTLAAVAGGLIDMARSRARC